MSFFAASDGSIAFNSRQLVAYMRDTYTIVIYLHKTEPIHWTYTEARFAELQTFIENTNKRVNEKKTRRRSELARDGEVTRLVTSATRHQ